MAENVVLSQKVVAAISLRDQKIKQQPFTKVIANIEINIFNNINDQFAQTNRERGWFDFCTIRTKKYWIENQFFWIDIDDSIWDYITLLIMQIKYLHMRKCIRTNITPTESVNRSERRTIVFYLCWDNEWYLFVVK